MNVRAWTVSLVALASFAATPLVQAGDFDKYVPEKAEFYVHMGVPKLFTSDLVRKVVPMTFDKYGDTLVQFAGMAKAINPAAPDIPEEQLKEGLKKASDPKEVAKFFDKIKDAVTDIVIAGSGENEDAPEAIILVKCEMITPELVEMIAGFAALNPQAKLQRIKKSGGTIYAISPPNQPQKVYVTVPEKGILAIAFTEDLAEGTFAPKGKPSENLAKQIAKRGANDFLFVAGVGKADAEFTNMAISILLDKDITGKAEVTFKDAAKASEKAEEANKNLGEFVEQIDRMLGDKADMLKTHMAETKAKADGKKVTASLSIPGKIFEELLKKDKEKE